MKKTPALVLTGVTPWREGMPGTVRIVDGYIAESGELSRNDELIEFDGRLLLPGLVNVHVHLDKAGLADRLTNESGTIDEARWRLKAAKAEFTVEDIKKRASSVLLDSVARGVTAVRSHVDIDPIVGLKGVEALLALREEFAGVLDLQIVAFPQEGILEHPGTEDLLREALKMGVDVVGGHLSILSSKQAMLEQLEVVFKLAAEFDRDVDVHTDFGIDFDMATSRHADGKLYPDGLGAVHLAEKTIQAGFEGRVAASHLCGLDSLSPDLRENVIELLLRAGISVIALPASNLYAHGRNDPSGSRRGVTRIRELLAAGVPVAVGPDNIRDPFDPFMGCDLFLNAALTAVTCQMVTGEDFITVMELHTSSAAEIMRLPNYGLQEGCAADLVVLEARSVGEILDGYTLPLLVLKGGLPVARNRTIREFDRRGLKPATSGFKG